MSSTVVAYTSHIVVDFNSCVNRPSDFILCLVRNIGYLYKLGYSFLSPSYFTQVYFSPLGNVRCFLILHKTILIMS